jgi:two-component system, response regulator
MVVMNGDMKDDNLQSGIILLVEDNADDSVLTERALRRGGLTHKVVVVRDGAEALEYLFGGEGSSARELPVFVLLDLKLPKVHGLEVLERIRADKRTKDLPVIVLSSSDEERDLVESYRLGADRYVRKTVDFLGFCETVWKMGSQWQSLRAKPDAPGRPDR